MLIVDASSLYEVLSDGPNAELVRERLGSDPDFGAPHLVDAEVLGIIRRHAMLRRLDATAAQRVVQELRNWPGVRYPHRQLLDRAWELRANVRTWDALYVALAEALGATLLTLDRRLARVPGLRCDIEAIGGAPDPR